MFLMSLSGYKKTANFFSPGDSSSPVFWLPCDIDFVKVDYIHISFRRRDSEKGGGRERERDQIVIYFHFMQDLHLSLAVSLTVPQAKLIPFVRVWEWFAIRAKRIERSPPDSNSASLTYSGSLRAIHDNDVTSNYTFYTLTRNTKAWSISFYCETMSW